MALSKEIVCIHHLTKGFPGGLLTLDWPSYSCVTAWRQSACPYGQSTDGCILFIFVVRPCFWFGPHVFASYATKNVFIEFKFDIDIHGAYTRSITCRTLQRCLLVKSNLMRPLDNLNSQTGFPFSDINVQGNWYFSSKGRLRGVALGVCPP